MADQICTLCDQLGTILGGHPECEQGTCSVTLQRRIPVTILGRPVQGGEVLHIALQFQDVDAQGRALCLGEIVLLEPEVNRFTRDLARQGIRVTAIHNHWLDEHPRLIYVHFEAIMNPVRFARGVAPAVRRLEA